MVALVRAEIADSLGDEYARLISAWRQPIQLM
jgi:hypothetical protein